jgi:methionine-rich copper-binding protein CopC
MRKLVSLLLVAFLSFLTMPMSSAHVTIVSSFPERFANVNPIPTEVWIQFSGELQTLDGEAVNSLEVIDSTGIAVNFEDPIIEWRKNHDQDFRTKRTWCIYSEVPSCWR